MRGRRSLVGIAALLLATLAGAGPPAQAPSLDEIANTGINGIGELGFVQLRDGVYEGAPYVAGGAARPMVSLLRELSVHGDLDGAAGEERALLLSSTTGGSGERIYLAAFGRGADGQIRNIASVLVGDRVKLRALAIDSPLLVLDVVETAPGEAACCGTRLARRSYRLEDATLQLVGNETRGRLSLAAISGIEWTLVEHNAEALAEGIRAPTLRISEGQAAGFSGCNNFHARLQEPAAGEIRLEPTTMISTRMACEESRSALESGYLADLSAINRYTFLQGRLVLGWQRGESSGRLTFRR
ncbi:MAG: META domain-containing protein [Gammaproteobacteria bacterium]|jgi:heat shock protein HslJ|nr:META domain-containing protein [Gammaproteobacteria bacterium]MBK6582332.1 META domain-containing protein [Gammaproteobacteria bacterium]MBK7171439.1 META domain-containing protein [Gammaproteobacteria bacterium]MBK7521396.1 META domain-containing protein [Gammaproteobacteria bacterium]MBK7729174.1 META domain-containing protein [Gammaproteobacteria bacterium]